MGKSIWWWGKVLIFGTTYITTEGLLLSQLLFPFQRFIVILIEISSPLSLDLVVNPLCTSIQEYAAVTMRQSWRILRRIFANELVLYRVFVRGHWSGLTYGGPTAWYLMKLSLRWNTTPFDSPGEEVHLAKFSTLFDLLDWSQLAQRAIWEKMLWFEHAIQLCQVNVTMA